MDMWPVAYLFNSNHSDFDREVKKMGAKLLWLGLTIMLAVKVFIPTLPLDLVGALVMIIGVILLLLDR